MSALINIFIISSSEAIELAKAVSTNLDGYNTTIWDRSVFLPGETPVGSLVKSIGRNDFAIVILSPDDLTKSRGTNYASPRDNVIYEFGMCTALLGIERTIYLFPKSPVVKIPSDINGINGIPYNYHPTHANLPNLLRPATNLVETTVNALGPRSKVKSTVYDFKAQVDIYYFPKKFTKAHAERLAVDLLRYDIESKIIEHDHDLSPDTLFIGTCVPVYYARAVLDLVSYEVKYLYRLDYPEVEGGDCKGFKIGVGYSSAYNKKDTDIRYRPVPVTARQLKELRNPNLNNTQFHKLLYEITMQGPYLAAS